MHWKCIVSFDKRGRAGEEVKPSHIGGGQGGEVDQAGEQDGNSPNILLTITVQVQSCVSEAYGSTLRKPP